MIEGRLIHMSRRDWNDVLENMGINEISLGDEEYDQVIHLITAANGADKFFGSDTNNIRNESVEVARRLDERISNGWIGHGCLNIIDNSTDFGEKRIEY